MLTDHFQETILIQACGEFEFTFCDYAKSKALLPLVLPVPAQVPDVAPLGLGPDDALSLKDYWDWQCESDALRSTRDDLQLEVRPVLEG